MDLQAKFEAKRQELARLEQREAFLRSQLEEAVQVRLQLVGQLALLQELYQEQIAENTHVLAANGTEEVSNGSSHPRS